jgi:hypothetical protein
MMIHYPEPTASIESLGTSDVQQAADCLAARMMFSLKRALCGLHGHDNLMHFEKDRMFLQCVSCGHESPGWVLPDTRPYERTAPVRRRPVIAPHFVGERRVA